MGRKGKAKENNSTATRRLLRSGWRRGDRVERGASRKGGRLPAVVLNPALVLGVALMGSRSYRDCGFHWGSRRNRGGRWVEGARSLVCGGLKRGIGLLKKRRWRKPWRIRWFNLKKAKKRKSRRLARRRLPNGWEGNVLVGACLLPHPSWTPAQRSNHYQNGVEEERLRVPPSSNNPPRKRGWAGRPSRNSHVRRHLHRSQKRRR